MENIDNPFPDGFPNPLADKKTKESKAYILAYAKAMYTQFGKYGIRSFWNDRTQYGILESYAMGIQPVDKYKKRMDSWGSDEPGKNSFLNIDWQILNLATKFVNIIVDKIVATGYDVSCKAIDPIALDAQKQQEASMRAVLEHKKWFETVGIPLDTKSLGFSPDMIPDHIDDIELHMNMNYKDEYSMNCDNAIKLAFTNNEFEQVRREYIRDSVIYGPQAVETKNDAHGNTKIKRIYPGNLIIANSQSEDFKNATHGGYIENMSFAELQTAAGNQFTTLEYDKIYKDYSKLLGPAETDPRNLYNNDTSYQNTNERVVSVMKFYYKTAIQNTYVKKQDSRGNSRIYEQGPNTKEKEGQEIIRDTYEVIFEGYWIVNSDYMYDFGKMKDMEVDEKNPCAVQIPIHVIWPNMLNGKGYSILNSCLPIFDGLQNNWLNFQHMLAQIRPDGEAINIDALADIAFGSGGAKLAPKDIIELYYKKGTLLYSSRGLDGQQNGNAVPITPMNSNNYEKANGYLNNVFSLIAILREITGMNAAVDASTPANDTLVGTSQMAELGAKSAIGYLFSADKLMVKHIAESSIRLTQNAIRRGEVSGYIDSIGVGAVTFWEVNKNITQRQLGIMVLPRPTQAEWADFYNRISRMADAGAISASDYIVMMEMTNLRQARQYMALVERRRKREEAKQAQMVMEQQAQLNQQSAMVTAQAAQEALQMEMTLKGSLIDKERDKALDEIHTKYGYELRLMEMQMAQKAESESTQARTAIINTSLKNEANQRLAETKKIEKSKTA